MKFFFNVSFNRTFLLKYVFRRYVLLFLNDHANFDDLSVNISPLLDVKNEDKELYFKLLDNNENIFLSYILYYKLRSMIHTIKNDTHNFSNGVS